MTFSIPEKRRPHLRQKLGIWWCSDPVTCGMGRTQKEAYNDWKAKRELIGRMHSNQLPVDAYSATYGPISTHETERHGSFYCNHGST